MNIQEQLEEFLNLPISESAKQDLLDKIEEALSRADKLGMAAKRHREQAKSAIGLAGVNKHIGQAEKLEQRADKSRATIAPTSKVTPNNDRVGIPSRLKAEQPKQEVTQTTKVEQPKQESDVTKRTKELIAKHKENIFKAAGNPYKDSAMKTLTQGTKKTLDNAFANSGTGTSKPTLAKADTTSVTKSTPTIADRLKKIEKPKEEVKQEVSKPVEKVETKSEQQKLDLGTPKQEIKTTKIKATKVKTAKKPKTTKTVSSEQVAKKKSGRPKKTK